MPECGRCPACGPVSQAERVPAAARLKVATRRVDGPEVDPRLAALSAASLRGTDPALAFANVFVQLGIIAAVALGLIWLGRRWYRWRLLRLVARQFPENAGEIRAAGHAVPLMRRPPKAPADPYARTHRVVVAPLGDGRPGESFWAPGPSKTSGSLGPDGSRTDATVTLSEGTHMLVVCLGRVGSRWRDHEVEPAAQRVEVARAAYVEPRSALGPVDRVPTAAGTGWRTTCIYRNGRALTDTHIDHDGWAFIVGVLSVSWHARAVEALDGILATWRWIPDDVDERVEPKR